MIFQKIKNQKTFLLEIIAIFIGISASFWVENYREDQQDNNIKKEIIQNIYLNLHEDSLIVASYLNAIQIHETWYLENIETIDPEVLSDSVLINTHSYMQLWLRFFPKREGYERMINSNIEVVLPFELHREISDIDNNDYNDYLLTNDLAQRESNKRNDFMEEFGVGRGLKNYSRIKIDNLVQMFRDQRFKAMYQSRTFLLNAWEAKHVYYMERTKKLRVKLKEYYKLEYKEDLDKTLKNELSPR